MKKLSSILFFGFCAVSALLIILSTYFIYLGGMPIEENRVSFLVKNGSTANEVASCLEKEGLIRDSNLFKIYYLVANRFCGKLIIAGEYSFFAGENVFDIFRKLTNGETVNHKITIPEGLITQKVIDLVKSSYGVIDNGIEYDFQNGSLMPDTYAYKYGESAYNILRRMQISMDKFLDKEWENVDPRILGHIKNKQDVIILASIIEKESMLDQEKPLIASVYMNRLKNGMKLDADPSVIFAINSGTNFGIRLLYDDLRIQSPYNTYLNKGLPPGPICNPSRGSINAAMHPSDSEYLYFVADGYGAHKFAKNFKEQLQNINLYRKTIKKIISAKE